MAIQFKIMAKVGRTVVFFEIIGAKSMTVSFAESSGGAILKCRVMGRFLTPQISTNGAKKNDSSVTPLTHLFGGILEHL